MVALLLFLPAKLSRNVASPFSSVMLCMSAPVCLMSPLLSHTARKPARAGHLSKMVPITYINLYYTEPVFIAVKAEIFWCGTEKRDYRNQRAVCIRRERSAGGVTSGLLGTTKSREHSIFQTHLIRRFLGACFEVTLSV